MDKIDPYRQLIRKVLIEHADFANQHGVSDLETQVLLDDENGRYMILRYGWLAERRIRSIIIYIRLHKGKIWVEEDWTEEGITNKFLRAGVPKEKIVLGFHHPIKRPFTEFAVA